MHGSSEPDVATDPHLAGSRESGGGTPDRPRDPETDPDGTSTTGTDRSGEFVGRTAGLDAGYAGETGAEARSEEENR